VVRRSGVEGVVAIRPISAERTACRPTWGNPLWIAVGLYGYGWEPSTFRARCRKTRLLSSRRRHSVRGNVTVGRGQRDGNPKQLAKFVEDLATLA
jgi:hypothetical protein